MARRESLNNIWWVAGYPPLVRYRLKRVEEALTHSSTFFPSLSHLSRWATVYCPVTFPTPPSTFLSRRHLHLHLWWLFKSKREFWYSHRFSIWPAEPSPSHSPAHAKTHSFSKIKEDKPNRVLMMKRQRQEYPTSYCLSFSLKTYSTVPFMWHTQSPV
jgi:hypothetical protein